MKRTIASVALSITLFSGLTAEAVMLPHPIRVYLFNNMAGTSIRFDGLINFPNGTMYVPVVPALEKKVDKLEIVYTYPDKKNLADEPEIIVFNNNYSLLKVIKDGNKCTLTKYSQLPEVVKTGILPQDMLVPNGFFVYENMKGLTGNLEIPITETKIETSSTVAQSDIQQKKSYSKQPDKKVVKSRKRVLKTVMPKELDDKMYLVTNFDSNYLKVFLPGRPEPIYGLKLKGILKDVAVTPDKKYLLAAVFGKDRIDVADVRNEQIAKSIELSSQPSEIVIDKLNNRAYILSYEGKSIYAINLDKMIISEKVNLDASPYRLTISPDGTELAYADRNSDIVYILKINEEYKNVPVTKCKNISKIIFDENNRIYILSRTKNELIVNDYNLDKPYITGEEEDPKGVILQKKLAINTRKMLGGLSVLSQNSESNDFREIEPETATIKEVSLKTASKPTEMLLFKDKLFVLCSEDNVLSILNTNTLKQVEEIKLPFKGFPRKITRIDNSNLALITDSDSKKYAVLNIETNKIEGVYPIDIPVYSITIIDKINNINLLEQSL